MDGVLHIAPVRNGMVGAARGEWTEGDVFVLEYNEIARISVWTMRFVFRGDQLQLDVYGENGAFSLQGTRE